MTTIFNCLVLICAGDEPLPARGAHRTRQIPRENKRGETPSTKLHRPRRRWARKACCGSVSRDVRASHQLDQTPQCKVQWRGEGGIQLQRRAAHFIQVLLPATFCNDEGGGDVFVTVCHGIKWEIVLWRASRANHNAKQMLWRDAPRFCLDTATPRLQCMK